MGKTVLTGKLDRKEKKKKALIRSLVARTLGSFAIAILVGFWIGGANMDGSKELIESLINGSVSFEYMDIALMGGLIAALVADAYAYTDYEKRKNVKENEHGTSSLLTAKDLPMFNRQFFWDPAIVKKYDPKAKTMYDEENQKVICVKTPQKNKKKIYDACFENTKILGQDVYLSMNAKFMKRNLNTITIGGSGQGKSYSELFPNTLSANSNYVFTDPSGEIYQKTGKFLESQGYKLKVFNVDEFNLSMAYNPIAYIKNDKDYNILVDSLVNNINTEKSSNGNDFFDKAAKSLDCALIALLRELYPTDRKNITEYSINLVREEHDENDFYPYQDKSDDEIAEEIIERNKLMQTFSNVMRLLHMAEQETDENGNTSSKLDKMFEDLEKHNPRSYAVAMWKDFKVGGPKVCNEVIISSAADFGKFFNNPDIKWLTRKDELKLDELASEQKCALFLIIPQSTSTYNFLCSMIYSQLFDITEKSGKQWRDKNHLDDPVLPRHLSFWLDEFANIGKIPNFLKLLAVVRKYNIDINIIVQAMSQLKSLYPKEEWETILGNLDSMIYLGGMEPSTVKWLSDKIGKETAREMSYSTGGKGSESYHNIGSQLVTTDQIEQMPRAYEFIFVSGCKPIQTKKYNLSKHPNYKYSGEADSKNNLNLSERFKDNQVDEDELDEYTLLEDEITCFDFSTIRKIVRKLDGKRRRPIVKLDAKTEPDKEENTQPIFNSDGTCLSDEEKESRKNEIDNLNQNLNQDFENVVKRYGATNFELYAVSSGYEFETATDFTIEDFEGLAFEEEAS